MAFLSQTAPTQIIILQQIIISQVLLRQPQQTGGAISNALGGMNIDFETFAILLALAGLAGAYALYQVTRQVLQYWLNY